MKPFRSRKETYAAGRDRKAEALSALFDHTVQSANVASCRYPGYVNIVLIPRDAPENVIHAAFDKLAAERKAGSLAYREWLNEAILSASPSDPSLAAYRRLCLDHDMAWFQASELDDGLHGIRTHGLPPDQLFKLQQEMGAEFNDALLRATRLARACSEAVDALCADPQRALRLLIGSIERVTDDVIASPEVASYVVKQFKRPFDLSPAGAQGQPRVALLMYVQRFAAETGTDLAFGMSCLAIAQKIRRQSGVRLDAFAAREIARFSQEAAERLAYHYLPAELAVSLAG